MGRGHPTNGPLDCTATWPARPSPARQGLSVHPPPAAGTNAGGARRYATPSWVRKREAGHEAPRRPAGGLRVVIVSPARVMGGGGTGRSSTALGRRFWRRGIPAHVDGTLNVVGVQ